MIRIVWSYLLVLMIIYVVPIVVYGSFAALTGMTTPAGVSPAQYLVSVLISKMGTATGFVLLFYFARDAFQGRWLLYAVIWWFTFLFGELGQAVGPAYGPREALAGLISETIYLPASAYVISKILHFPPRNA
ncbi:MAG: hypothetical protein HY042_09500 [Spirochaetia bacterium]|nr:hypothetical protein [Spirochaetia bacterium]